MSSAPSSSSNLGWLDRRREMPQVLRLEEALADLTLVAVDSEGRDRHFRAHKFLLACHSEYFYHLLTSGMKEAEEGVVRFGNVNADVLKNVLDYVYTGEVHEDLTFGSTRALLLAANMLQMVDLEAATLQGMAAKCITPQRCLKIFLFVREADETLYAKAAAGGGGGGGSSNGSGSGSTASSLESVAAAVKAELEAALVKIVRDRWHIIVSPANHVDSEDDDYVASLTDLDLTSLKAILSIKSDQEDIGDFSFSFNQTDLALAVVQWIKADFEGRHQHFHDLSEYFCYHQVNSLAKESVRNLMDRINSFCDVHLPSSRPRPSPPPPSSSPSSSPSPSPSPEGFPPCRGFWCPHRRIAGLVIAHAWSPHASNRITCDHIFYYFTIPKLMGTAAKSRLAEGSSHSGSSNSNSNSNSSSSSSSSSEDSGDNLCLGGRRPVIPLHNDFFYDVGQFGELGDGEKHLLQPNNCLYLPSIGSHMLLTFDSGSLSGTVVDPVRSRYQCPRHHSQMYHFCPSSVAECVCEFTQMLTCVSSAESEGDRVNVISCPNCRGNDDFISFDPSCETFRQLAAPPMPVAKLSTSASASMAAAPMAADSSFLCGRVAVCCFRDRIYSVGGFLVRQGKAFSFVHCTYDLQDFGGGRTGAAHGHGHGHGRRQQVDNDDACSDYKSGHSHLKTSIGYLRDAPEPNLVAYRCLVPSAAGPPPTSPWTEVTSLRLPVPVGDAATAFFREELWLIGGFVVKYDEELQLFYQEPLRETWIYSFKEESWRRGPPLPSISDESDDDDEEEEVVVEGEGRERLGSGYTKGSAYVYQGRLVFSGGACLKKNHASESNQIYEYVPNARVFLLEREDKGGGGGDGGAGGKGERRGRWRWRLLLNLGYFASKFREADYSVIAVFPADVTLTRLKVRRDPNAGAKFLVKYLNINFPLGGGGGGGDYCPERGGGKDQDDLF